MAGASDKAQFYLEQSVPELREWERRKIFTREEIAKISRKRSDFEHVVNARESKPSDYARYVEYELRIDMLRRKRVKRLGIKSTAHTGQRKIFRVLDRATRKFHGDIRLWMQYIEYARKQRANKKLNHILTDALRLHPANANLWIYAATYAMDVQADIVAARAYMQRGLRFCKSSKILYLEYAKLEMTYVAKLDSRRKVLGLHRIPDIATTEKTGDDSNSNLMRLESFDMLDPPHEQVNDIDQNLSNMDACNTSQVLGGAIPIAIFDSATQEFPLDEVFFESFFEMLVKFAQVSCIKTILRHLLNYQLSNMPLSPTSLNCQCRLPVVGIATESVEFPSALRETLRMIKSSLAKADNPPRLAEKLLIWLSQLSKLEDLVPELSKVLSNTTKSLQDMIRASPNKS